MSLKRIQGLLIGYTVFAIAGSLHATNSDVDSVNVSGAETGAATDKAPATDAAADQTKKKSDVKNLAGVDVVAPKTSDEAARSTQQLAPNLINLRTEDQIKKLPDVNTAEAVRRIPGVSIETDEGEGRYVNIRGFDADLNSTTYAGVHLVPTNNASPFGGYRGVALDSIPTGFIGAIKATKSNLPSQDAEALGGTIEVLPKTAPAEQGPFFDGQVGGGYEALRGTPVADFSFAGGGRFGPFSIVLTASNYTDSRGIDDLEPAYYNDSTHPYQAVNNIEQRDYELHRRRHGYAIDLGYKPDDNNEWYFRAFDAGYTETYKRQFTDINPDGNSSVLADGSIQDTLTFPGGITKSLRDEKESSREQLFMAGGKNDLGSTTIDYRVAYVEGTYKKPFDYGSTFTYNPPSAPNGSITYSPTGPGHVPLYAISGAPGYLDPTNYTLSGFSNSTANNYDREVSYAINSDTTVDWGNFTNESIKFGLSARMRHKQTSAQPYSFDSIPSLPLSSASSGSSETYYGGRYQNGVDIIPGYLQTLLGQGSISSSDVTASQQQFLDAHEDVYAGYGEYAATYGKLGMLAGVRFEDTRTRGNAFSAGVDANGAPFALPVSTNKSYSNFFPSVQLRYELSTNDILRAAYSSTIARPGFNQANPALAVDLGSGIVTTGNTGLKPATANSFDFSYEKYLSSGGILSAGVFDKEISNYIIPTETNQTLPNNNLYPGSSQAFNIFTFKNAPSSYARGLELNWSQTFSNLPGIWKGLGAGANYTLVDSRVEIRPGEYSKLPSTSKDTWNATLFYDYKGLSLNLAAYRVSEDLFAIGTSRSSDVYNASRTSMDFGASYAFPEHWSLYFYAKNLLDTKHTFYLGTPNRPIQREFYGLTFLTGVRFEL